MGAFVENRRENLSNELVAARDPKAAVSTTAASMTTVFMARFSAAGAQP
jgi:hypothetical protein